MESGLLREIEIENFRNIESLKLHFHPSFNFFFGENAQGKTSLIEAVYFLSELKSFRTLESAPLIRHGKKNSLLKGHFESAGLHYDIQVELESERKEVYLNGKTPRPYRKLRKLAPIVLFVPESVLLFRSAPSERRRYFDHLFSLLLEPFAADAAEYTRILRQKLKLLDGIREGRVSPAGGETQVWNERLAEIGARITVQRFELTRELEPIFCSYFRRLSRGDWEIKADYQPYLATLCESWDTQKIQGLLLEEIERRWEEEIGRNQVLVGPHRDDWAFTLGKARLKEEGSQGQHRVSVAALKLAELEMIRRRGMTPLALFDDLLSELDEGRSRRVLEELGSSPCQVFLTSIAPQGVSLLGLKGQGFPVQGGRVLEG